MEENKITQVVENLTDQEMINKVETTKNHSKKTRNKKIIKTINILLIITILLVSSITVYNYLEYKKLTDIEEDKQEIITAINQIDSAYDNGFTYYRAYPHLWTLYPKDESAVTYDKEHLSFTYSNNEYVVTTTSNDTEVFRVIIKEDETLQYIIDSTVIDVDSKVIKEANISQDDFKNYRDELLEIVNNIDSINDYNIDGNNITFNTTSRVAISRKKDYITFDFSDGSILKIKVVE